MAELSKFVESILEAYSVDFAPGATERLRRDLLDLKARNDGRLSDKEAAAAVFEFLEGDEEAPLGGALTGESDRAFYRREKFFRPGYVRPDKIALERILARLPVKTQSVKPLVAEFAASYFGFEAGALAEALVMKIHERSRWHHLLNPPALPFHEQRVREALAPYRHHFQPGKFEETAMAWAGSFGHQEQHLVNTAVAKALSSPVVAKGRLYDDEPISPDWRDSRFHQAKPDDAEQALHDDLKRSGHYAG